MLVFMSLMPFAVLALLPLLTAAAALPARLHAALERWAVLLAPAGGIGLAVNALINTSEPAQAAVGAVLGAAVLVLGRTTDADGRAAGHVARAVLIGVGLYLAAALDLPGLMSAVLLTALGAGYPALVLRAAQRPTPPPPSAAQPAPVPASAPPSDWHTRPADNPDPAATVDQPAFTSHTVTAPETPPAAAEPVTSLPWQDHDPADVEHDQPQPGPPAVRLRRFRSPELLDRAAVQQPRPLPAPPSAGGHFRRRPRTGL